MINLYKILGWILIPLIKINTLIRIKKNKELSLRYKERYGITSKLPINNKKVIWIHAASLGEFKSTDHLIKKYFKDYTLLVTTTTVSAANFAQQKYGDKIIHQFAPLDINIWVKRFLLHWNPAFVIWVESDLWPTTLNMIKKSKIEAILVNVRLSPKSLKRWKLIPSLYNNLMHCFNEIFAQSRNDQKRIQSLSNKNIEFIGNLKLTQSNLLSNISKTKSKYLTIMLANTHHQEETQILPILKNLLKRYSNLKLIIAPRHPERSKIIENLCLKNNLASELHSRKKGNSNKILIIDSFGILDEYYAISDIVFLGGSLVDSGGHNPLEPAINNCAIITGPILFNWQNIFEEMIKDESCIIVESEKMIKNEIKILIDDKNKLDRIKTNAYKFAQKNFINTNLLEETINQYLKKYDVKSS